MTGRTKGGTSCRLDEIIAFADTVPAKWFRGRSWMAELLKAMNIEVLVVDLPPELRARVCAAQERQYAKCA